MYAFQPFDTPYPANPIDAPKATPAAVPAPGSKAVPIDPPVSAPKRADPTPAAAVVA